MSEVGDVGLEVIWVAVDSPPPDGQREGNEAFGGQGIAAREMEALLKVGGFDMDRYVEMTLTQAHIDI